MLPVFLLIALAASPTVPGALGEDAQWAAILACPKVSVAGGAAGSGVVVGVKDGFAYLLTAAHVVPLDGVEVRFTSREAYPKPAWFADRPEVVARWPDPDVALVRFKVGEREVPTLPLAGPWQRPKEFPVSAWSVGLGPQDAARVWADRILAKQFVRRERVNPAFFWETDRPPEPGRSGGPLLDDRGRVIGICVAARDGRGYYAHLDEILAALKQHGHGWLVTPKP